MESYKNQIAELEGKVSARSQEVETVKFELEQTRTKLKITSEERKRDTEMLELYQERLREMELTSHRVPATLKTETQAVESGNHDDFTEEELMGDSFGLDGELDDAITGTTMTDLKLQVKKLQRELKSVKKNEADASRILVLENLLEDANRMKGRYEADYMTAHREKLVLQRDLEEIRSGKALGDGYVVLSPVRGSKSNAFADQKPQLRCDNVLTKQWISWILCGKSTPNWKSLSRHRRGS